MRRLTRRASCLEMAFLCAALSVLSPWAADAGPEPSMPDAMKEAPASKKEKKLPGVLDRNHHLGPGDVVEIVVENFGNLSAAVRLFNDGTFDHPVLGTVQAAGLTTKELAERVTEALRKEVRRPRVSVLLKDIYVPPKEERPIPKITILGAASKKGDMELPDPRPLRTILALIGPRENADLSDIRVRYPDGSARSADFSQFPTTGESQDDFDIVGGEEIILLEKAPEVKPEPVRYTVLGHVVKPGSFSVEGQTSILEVLEKAGGPKPGAELERVEVTGPAHPAKTLVNVDKYILGDTEANYICQQGDVFVIPSKPYKVLLVGEVAAKGWRSIREGETLLPLFLEAGVAGDGDYSKTQIIRRGKDGKPVYKTVNIRDIMKQKRPDEVLYADDVIFIPHKKVKKNLPYYLGNVLGPAWLLRSLVPVP
jgi:polysaccharide biosynthesis/export protein